MVLKTSQRVLSFKLIGVLNFLTVLIVDRKSDTENIPYFMIMGLNSKNNLVWVMMSLACYLASP